MKVRRFYMVKAPRGVLIHRADSITEGNRTWCGRSMRLGWKWWRTLGKPLVRQTLRCPRCEVAT